ncbi:hypothetical protein EZS27_028110 [termite gut metagenome]|uniref:SusD/RagB family nutrient-binding outer membrane lipoprotein n=1 Tax=termite gut metagenome TaxID=433724 RepID=A0A5J4QLS3_9ZZZZ
MKKIYILALAILPLLLPACTDNFEEFNEEQKKPSTVAGEALFSNAQKDLIDQISSTNVNRNIFKLWTQYWTETTYLDESNYDITTRNIDNNTYQHYYREALKDLLEAETIISTTEYPLDPSPKIKENKLHIIALVRAYAFQQLVDIFGAVPYGEALDIDNVYPAYEAGDAIYKDLINKVDAAVKGLDTGYGAFGSADLYYSSDINKWIKFGNALKIKLGITLADYDKTLAESTILSGVNGGTFTSSQDDALFNYQQSSPNFNPLYADIIASGRNDFVPTTTILEIMNTLEDPRRAAYFTLYDGNYVGGPYGYASAYISHSHIATVISAPDFQGILLTYGEIQFYLAEAAARGFAVPQSAEAYYKEAVKESFAFWGIQGAEDYLDKPEIKYNQAKWQELIATQEWLAFYTRGLEGYTTWRRLDYPRFNVAELISTESDIPTRFTFPVNEQTLNKLKYDEAVKLIGGDLPTTRIFWDVN